MRSSCLEVLQQIYIIVISLSLYIYTIYIIISHPLHHSLLVTICQVKCRAQASSFHILCTKNHQDPWLVLWLCSGPVETSWQMTWEAAEWAERNGAMPRSCHPKCFHSSAKRRWIQKVYMLQRTRKHLNLCLPKPTRPKDLCHEVITMPLTNQ